MATTTSTIMTSNLTIIFLLTTALLLLVTHCIAEEVQKPESSEDTKRFEQECEARPEPNPQCCKSPEPLYTSIYQNGHCYTFYDTKVMNKPDWHSAKRYCERITAGRNFGQAALAKIESNTDFFNLIPGNIPVEALLWVGGEVEYPVVRGDFELKKIKDEEVMNFQWYDGSKMISKKVWFLGHLNLTKERENDENKVESKRSVSLNGGTGGTSTAIEKEHKCIGFMFTKRQQRKKERVDEALIELDAVAEADYGLVLAPCRSPSNYFVCQRKRAGTYGRKSPSAESQSSSAGLVVGVSLAVFFAVCLIGAAAFGTWWFVIRKTNKKLKMLKAKNDAHKIEANEASTTEQQSVSATDPSTASATVTEQSTASAQTENTTDAKTTAGDKEKSEKKSTHAKKDAKKSTRENAKTDKDKKKSSYKALKSILKSKTADPKKKRDKKKKKGDDTESGSSESE